MIAVIKKLLNLLHLLPFYLENSNRNYEFRFGSKYFKHIIWRSLSRDFIALNDDQVILIIEREQFLIVTCAAAPTLICVPWQLLIDRILQNPYINTSHSRRLASSNIEVEISSFYNSIFWFCLSANLFILIFICLC